MTAICPECGFEAKTAQGLSSHRLIKHNAVPKVAEKEAQLSAEAVSQVVDELYEKLHEQSSATKEAMSALEDKVSLIYNQLIDRLADQFNQLSERDNQMAQVVAEAAAQAVAQPVAEAVVKVVAEGLNKPPIQLVDFASFMTHKDSCPECQKLYQEDLLALLPRWAEEHGYIQKLAEETPSPAPPTEEKQAEETPAKDSLKDTLSAIYGKKE